MSILKKLNAAAKGYREVVIDLETTGLTVVDGHRIVEIAAVELREKRLTGREFYAMVDPERGIPPEATKIHGITQEKIAECSPFREIARQLREFIGNDPVVITCRTKETFTLDVCFLNMEFEKAGVPGIPESQWVNVRKWSEAMFGDKQSTLDKILDRYSISRKGQDEQERSSLIDARCLSEAYPHLLKDYNTHKEKQIQLQLKNQKNNPSP